MALAALRNQLEALARAYPLPAGWEAPELFDQVVAIGAAEIALVGLASAGPAGAMATGSAATLSAPPLDRAYFELVERASLIDARREAGVRHTTRDAAGAPSGTVAHETVFPPSPLGIWQHSLSNGVAVGQSWGAACAKSLSELIERDRVLRSWYGGPPPTRLTPPARAWPSALDEGYDVRAYHFAPGPAALGPRCEVVGVFGLPRDARLPYSYGLGVGDSHAHALASAVTEWLQAVGFLWGEALAEIEPAFSTTPDYHQAYFLVPGNAAAVRAWLEGEVGRARAEPRTGRHADAETTWVDLTPAHLAGRLWVAKALDDRAVPLVFGRGNPALRGPLPTALEVHPLS